MTRTTNPPVYPPTLTLHILSVDSYVDWIMFWVYILDYRSGGAGILDLTVLTQCQIDDVEKHCWVDKRIHSWTTLKWFRPSNYIECSLKDLLWTIHTIERVDYSPCLPRVPTIYSSVPLPNSIVDCQHLSIVCIVSILASILRWTIFCSVGGVVQGSFLSRVHLTTVLHCWMCHY